jgi:ABC-type nitrate/sulfonate/bicarbonate transport system permease component
MIVWATIWRYTPLLLLAIVWEGVTQANLVAPNVLPRLSTVLATLLQMSQDDLARHMALSLARGAAGLTAALIIGVVAGVLMAWYRPIRLLIKPLGHPAALVFQLIVAASVALFLSGFFWQFALRRYSSASS